MLTHGQFLLYSLGFLMIILHLPGVFNPKNQLKSWLEISKTPALQKIMGLVLIIISFFLLSYKYDFQGQNWNLTIPILGYLLLLKGILLNWFPQTIKTLAKKMLPTEGILTFYSALGVVLGVALITIAKEFIS